MRYPKVLVRFSVSVVVFVLVFVVLIKPFLDRKVVKITTVPTFGTNPSFCDNPHCSIFSQVNYCNEDSAAAGNPSHYLVSHVTSTNVKVEIVLVHNNKSSVNEKYGHNLPTIKVLITAQTNRRLHILIVDPHQKRWQIPEWLIPIPSDPKDLPPFSHYYVKFPKVGQSFNIAVVRKANDEVIFDTCGARQLYFADQFLSLGTVLPEDHYVYGLGEHVVPSLRLPPRTYTLWNYDTATPKYNNLYGSHPFYLEHRLKSGRSHGVFLKNSNGMDITLDKTSLTYNVLGGVLDFYFFLGPTPESVIQQYQEVIGRPKMPPYWGLGFHQCRYGYKDVKELKSVVKRFKEASIPLDTMWTDIDYMDKYKDFTLSPTNFPEAEMKEFVNDLHQNDQHYVVIIDPGIKVEHGYEPYDTGIGKDIFIKTHDGNIYRGKVWPGVTAFPDFMNPSIGQYWENEIVKFHDKLPIDGIWLDMNEISSFHDGDMSEPKAVPDNLPYTINNQGSKQPLMKKTVSPSAVHYGGLKEYDVHNLYGHAETIVTSKALENMTKKRSFIIGRSTFPGTGAYGGHWTGDNHAKWEDLAQSVIDVLNFQLYGIPLVGADICGFSGDTTEELCARWMAVGAFYPFSRSHSQRRAKPQEPYLWDSVTKVSRNVLSIRYSLLPYYYTLFYKASTTPDSASPSATVLRPLFFEFPRDPETLDISDQFLIGDSILLTPALQRKIKSRKGYFPRARWYDYHNFNLVSEGGESLSLATPLTSIPIHVRGGRIIVTQFPAATTKATRRNKFRLLVALNSAGSANGELYWDDGESLKNDDNFLLVYFTVDKGKLSLDSYGPEYNGDLPSISVIIVLGLDTQPAQVTIDGSSYSQWEWNRDTHFLRITGLNLGLKDDFTIKWT